MPAVCNGLFNKNLNPGDRCPDGSIATPPPGTGGTGDNEVFGAWNQDSTPVSMDRWVSSLAYSENSRPVVQQTMPVFEAQDYFNRTWGAGSVAGASDTSKAKLNGMVAALRRYTGSELGTRGALEGAWNDAVTDASRSGVSVFTLLGGTTPLDGDGDGDGDRGSGGSRGYSGPVSSTTFMDERDVDRTANALALELIGRPLSDKELAKVTKRLRSEESANPTVTTPGVGSSMTESGLSAEGRSDVLREVISENPDFQQFQVDHTVLDSMLASLSKREKMVNG
jgi:hypothetical protein